MDSYNTAEEPSTERQQTPIQDEGRQDLHGSESSARQQVLSPESLPSMSKPKMARRASSKFHAPHKGKGFSVDDDADEYESELAQRQSQSSVAKSASGSGPGNGLRRQSSTLRRRPTAQATILPPVDSRGEDEEDAEDAQTPTAPRRKAAGDGHDSSS